MEKEYPDAVRQLADRIVRRNLKAVVAQLRRIEPEEPKTSEAKELVPA